LSLPNSTWFFVKGGVYAYMETIIQKSKMQIICDAQHIKISRHENSVKIGLGGITTDYDKVIIATTPGSVKNLLSDMTEQEDKIFRGFEDQSFKTTAHKDISIYNPYKSVHKTPMDLFYKYNSDSIGYNTYLNNVYKLQTKEHYNFAYNLDQDINKSDIIHKAHHFVPKYNLEHDSKMDLLKHINGENNTFYAGAYTSNGLHEGTTISAIKISEILGGIKIA
jgi:predicted NAD/FAD-binding protein